ncbi:MAG: mandelate racemase/muconate lactonizing enzyme family protein [Pirellulaceae bacterium]|jgi:L-alanine-DL-glutamate epimerase-like enolase superfamily enzyme|nr:mandelate racemase/muconate lactonizing enzyme family protein [Pirellulaceae bacterium]
MSDQRATDITIKEVRTSLEQIDYRTPIKFGGRVVVDVQLLNVDVQVETRDGRSAQGFGSMPVGNAWGWPSNTLSGDDTLRAMTVLGERIAAAAGQYDASGHPLEITHDLAHDYDRTAAEVVEQLDLAEPMPRLAQLVSASPVEAAIHDAYGKALQANSYNVLGAEFANRDMGHYLNADFAGEHLDAYTLREPKPEMPLYHLVGALDPLTDGDIEQRIGDEMPETLGEWIVADGLTHLKIKLSGDDIDWDVDRVLAIDRVAGEAQRQRGQATWWYSLDFNERCANVEYVLDFLHRITERSAETMSRVQYVEQPTHRDLRANPENRMHEAAKIKPVVIDESLVDFESLLLAREQGYSGVALKACKGQTEALLMGAAAQKYDLFLCVQDLTCIGFSFLHSASVAARMPSVAAIEGNGRQYCPAGNAPWVERFPDMFEITRGVVGTGCLNGVGLGF